MMSHGVGCPPTPPIGFGFTIVSSLGRVPAPPASRTAFIGTAERRDERRRRAPTALTPALGPCRDSPGGAGVLRRRIVECRPTRTGRCRPPVPALGARVPPADLDEWLGATFGSSV